MKYYLILGILQGLTEFLPISSSGHLVLFQTFLFHKTNLHLIVWLHFGTLISLIVFFSRNLFSFYKEPSLFLYTILVTVITGIIGIIGNTLFKKSFYNPYLTAFFLLIMGLILISTKLLSKGGYREIKDISVKDVLLLSIIQSFALLPGISRSGITIGFLLSRKIKPHDAFIFSFLVSIPLILGATLYESNEIMLNFNWAYATAGIVSFFTGLVALKIVSLFLNKKKFYLFGYYCIFTGIVAFYIISKTKTTLFLISQ